MRRTIFSFMYKIDEYVARFDFRGRGFDAGEVGRCATADPSAQARGPICDCAFRIGGCNGVFTLLEAQIQEVGGHIGDSRVGLMLAEHHPGLEFSQQADEIRNAKTKSEERRVGEEWRFRWAADH